MKSELNDLVSTLATHYGFEIKWCETLEKWIVRHEELHCAFYWSSNENIESFLDELKEYFMSVGGEKIGC